MRYFHLNHGGCAYWTHKRSCTTQVFQLSHLGLRVLRGFLSPPFGALVLHSACHGCLTSGLSPTLQQKTTTKSSRRGFESFAASVCLPVFGQPCGVIRLFAFSVPQLQNYSSFASRLRKRNVIVTTILSTLAYLSALELSFQLGSLNLSSQLLCFVHASNLLRAVFPAVVKVASYVCARLHHCVAVDATSGFHFLNPTLETSWNNSEFRTSRMFLKTFVNQIKHT